MSKKKRKKTKKSNIWFYIILIIIICASSSIIYYINTKSNLKVILKDNLELEVNSDIKVEDLITKIEDGKIKDGAKKIDTSKVGKKKINVLLTNSHDKEEEYTFEVSVVDKVKPVIDVEDKIVISLGDEVDLVSYAIVTDNYDKDLKATVSGNYDFNKEGEYNLRYYVKDSSGNETVKDIVLVVEKSDIKKMKDKTIKTSKGYTLKIRQGLAYVDGVLIANKTYSLPEDYAPKDPYQNLSDNCPKCLEKEVMNAFIKMQTDAKALGLNIWVQSGYRSYNSQKYLYNMYTNQDGKEAADTYSSRPGHSEHQTGLCFDLNSVESSFINTKEGKWIDQNCHLYGFTIRFPKDKEDETGYMYEPWHLRYVGEELAKKLYNNGDWLSLEDYFGITSKYED